MPAGVNNLTSESSKNATMLCSTARLHSAIPAGNILKAPELGTPHCNGQNVGLQWCPL